MMNQTSPDRPSREFLSVKNNITEIGYNNHKSRLIDHSKKNFSHINKTLKDIQLPEGDKAKKAIVISAGPSVKRTSAIERIKNSNFSGTIVTVDGSYIACLKKGLIPDYIITLDPHPTRVVRWFGDPDYKKHKINDDYFERQDLDIDLRNNSIKNNTEDIKLVNEYGNKSSVIICSVSSPSVVQRVKDAGMIDYWWNPIVDHPNKSDSITGQLYEINKLPCMNTGGTVGTAAWIFASQILNIEQIGITGADMGYYNDFPIEMTQTYYELLREHCGDKEKIKNYFHKMIFPLTGETFYTDPTYYWYRENFLCLLKNSKNQIWNCSEAGTFFGKNVKCVFLNDFIS